jgi:hypothetical protein
MRLGNIFRTIQAPVTTGVIVPSTMRGVLRQELRLSPPRLVALLAHRDLEVTLERTLVALANRNEQEAWFNQLNVAGGVGGGNAFNRVAVDLGQVTLADRALRLHFKELKAWNASDPPRAAIEEVFSYGALFSVLRHAGIAPYDEQPWPDVLSTRLHLIAPAEYFVRHGGVGAARQTLLDAEAELAALREVYPELAGVSFGLSPIVLPNRVRADYFVRCFDSSAVDALLQDGAKAASALDVLRPDKVEELTAWLRDGLLTANLN